MIPIETIKRLAIQCGAEVLTKDCLFTFEDYELQDFAHAIEAMTIDRCAEYVGRNLMTCGEYYDAIRALKDKE